MKVAVFGAAGFIGRHLCRDLATRGELLAFDVEARDDLGFPCREADVLAAAPDLTGVDAVVYLSQSPHYRAFPERGDHLFGVNVVGALRVVHEALRAGASRLVYASTGSVYAPSFEPLAEDAAVRRDDPYALSKSTAEDALRLVGGEMATCCVRLFGVYGPEQQTMMVPAIAQRVRERQAVTLAPHPDRADDRDGLRISLTFVHDLVPILGRLLATDVELPATLNVAPPEAVSIRQLACAIGEQLDLEPLFEPAPQPRTTDLIADTSRLDELLSPRFTELGEAMRRTLRGS